MNLLKDNQARETIERLQNRVRELELQMQYGEPENAVWLSMFGPPRKKLSAAGIVKRFEELYELLGVERKTSPESTRLEKKTEEVAQ